MGQVDLDAALPLRTHHKLSRSAFKPLYSAARAKNSIHVQMNVPNGYDKYVGIGLKHVGASAMSALRTCSTYSILIQLYV